MPLTGQSTADRDIDSLPCLDRCESERVLNTTDSPIRGVYGRVAVSSATVIRHKPGKRCLIRFELSTERVGKRSVLGKIRFKGADRRLNAISCQLWSSGWGADATIFTPRPLGVIPQWNMTLQEQLPGRALNPAEDRFLELQPLVAQTIRKLHSTPLNLDRIHRVDDELRILAGLLEQTCQTHPVHAASIRRVLDAMKLHAVALEDCTLTTVHRDFYFDQLIDGGLGGLALIDLDMVCLGPPALDAGNYLAHLTELGVRQPALQSRCAVARRSFLDSYLNHSPASTRSEIEAWYRLSLARHIHLCTKIPGRLHTLERLLDILRIDE